MKVIMYHYVRKNLKEYPYFKSLSISRFKRQIVTLKKKYGIISNENQINVKNNKVLLTFDDGLKDHLQVAKILKRNNITGIFFIPTQPLKNKKILNVHKTHLILGKKKSSLALKELKNLIINQNIIKNKNLFKSYNKIQHLSKIYNNHVKDEKDKIEFKSIINYLSKDIFLQSKILDKLMKLFKIKKKIKDIYLNNLEISKMYNMGMIIGSHGHSHRLLSKLTFKEQKLEISRSNKYLKKIIGKNLSHFCYPYGGKKSYNSNTIKILKLNKFKYAYSVNKADVNSNNLKNKPFEIPRYDCINF